MKRFLFSFLLLLAAVSTRATITFSMSDVKLQRSESIELPVNVTNDEVFAGFELKIFLPEGISFQGTTIKDCVKGAGRLEGFTIAGSSQSDGSYKMLAANLDGELIGVGEGTVLYLRLKADADANIGDGEIRLCSIRYSKDEVLHSLADISSKITIDPSTSSVHNAPVSIKNPDAWLLNGTRAHSASSQQSLSRGLYIINGKKVQVK